MTIIRPEFPNGYKEQAIAFRQLARHEEAFISLLQCVAIEGELSIEINNELKNQLCILITKMVTDLASDQSSKPLIGKSQDLPSKNIQESTIALASTSTSFCSVATEISVMIHPFINQLANRRACFKGIHKRQVHVIDKPILI